MKKTTYIIAYTLLVLACTFWLPWHIIVIIAAIFGYYSSFRKLGSFFVGLMIPFIIWVVIATIRDAGFTVSITDLISNLLGGIGSVQVYLLTGLAIGLASGFGALSGRLLYQLTNKKVTNG